MKAKLMGASIAALLVISLLFTTVPFAWAAEDAKYSYQLLNDTDGTFAYTLNIVVPQSLTSYYELQNHRSTVAGDFPKFVTPYALQPIANALRQIYPDDENFTNGVLTLVHQIPYVETVAQYYPVETLVRNEGDCDMFSLVAASILIAGGLEVVLLHYTEQEHMNLGVRLESEPLYARSNLFAITENNIKYYVAECTSTNWQQGWRVGECPDDLKNVYAQVITLEKHEPLSPGQVSASFQKLTPTSISLTVSPLFVLDGGSLTVKGQISPAIPNQDITLYERSSGSSWVVLGVTQTAANGEFTYTWKSETVGKLDIRASWTGNNQYAGTTSQPQNTLVMATYFVALIGLAVAAVITCVIAFIVSSRRRKARRLLEAAQPQAAPTVPSV